MTPQSPLNMPIKNLRTTLICRRKTPFFSYDLGSDTLSESTTRDHYCGWCHPSPSFLWRPLRPLVSSGLMGLQKQSFALASPQMTDPSLNAADCVTLLQHWPY